MGLVHHNSSCQRPNTCCLVSYLTRSTVFTLLSLTPVFHYDAPFATLYSGLTEHPKHPASIHFMTRTTN